MLIYLEKYDCTDPEVKRMKHVHIWRSMRMSIKQAVVSDLSTVKKISAITISEIYPHYYPKEAVDFFLVHHSEDNIMKDIERNRVFLP